MAAAAQLIVVPGRCGDARSGEIETDVTLADVPADGDGDGVGDGDGELTAVPEIGNGTDAEVSSSSDVFPELRTQTPN